MPHGIRPFLFHARHRRLSVQDTPCSGAAVRRVLDTRRSRPARTRGTVARGAHIPVTHGADRRRGRKRERGRMPVGIRPL